MSFTFTTGKPMGKAAKYFTSTEFKNSFAKQVHADTIGKGLPMTYMNDKRQIVKEFPNGTIEILKQAIA